MKQKIIEILNKYETCQDSGFNVIGTDFGKKEELAAELVKLFAIPVVMHSNNLYEAQNWKIYTPDDDECVVVMEDSFGTKRTFDVDDFVKLMDALNSVRDY